MYEDSLLLSKNKFIIELWNECICKGPIHIRTRQKTCSWVTTTLPLTLWFHHHRFITWTLHVTLVYMMMPGVRKHQESKGLLHGMIIFFKLQTLNPHVTRNNVMVHQYVPQVYISCTFIIMISSPKQKHIEERLQWYSWRIKSHLI